MRRTKFTSDVIEQIPRLVADGKSPSDIANEIGCKVTSLRVRCSQLKISLKRQNGIFERPQTAGRRRLVQMTMSLSPRAIERLRQQAEMEGMSEPEFVAALLEAIARDDLYKAVLDRR